ncbi:threonine--tRNA ligase [Candidatus Daviesbacteria bacterium RIFCSPLOWO2_01_FULL_39_12]|uniref:Threonine--tRNA ligase n=1 Tax=Candidatus Daviesbacteria bacterium RIFCSPLOWO2_01_FULL_39_12 TaxID=1797785 RepID=A0A1F5KUD5_9BACT|nr:MAG: threonine--tRNA ligase [Candidatus Daviesbacteria bacterium RIFCSPLOWO2_01_FULL_39_12]
MNNNLKDHRQIGQELDLFVVSERVGGGLPLFTPKGTIIRKVIHDFIEQLQKEFGYSDVWIPHLAKAELYKLSGHLEKYPEYFKVKSSIGDEFVLKPMDCPHHMEIFRAKPRSYKDLPIAYNEFTTNYRDEQSGELNGLLRVRALTIDDCHIFCREDQILEEARKVYKTIVSFYKAFNFEISVRLSFKDPKNKEKYIGLDKTWEKAENAIRELAKDVEFEKRDGIGEAAFYGPKLDFMIKDVLEREWQLATIQLDYFIPERLGVEYVDSDGSKKTPVVIHRAIAGSIERFIGILIEQYQGAFLTWLSPVQVIIVPISDRNLKYARNVFDQLLTSKIRVEIDSRAETMQSKIRDATLQKIPYILIIGGREEKEGKVAIRTREGKDLGTQKIDEFIAKVKSEIESKI